LHERLQARGELGCWGYQEPEQYAALLRGADVVLSTALHDFQGIAVIEAAAHGCCPLVPDGLAYPEWFDAGFRYTNETDAIARLLELGALKSAGQSLPRADVSAVSASALLPRYAAVLRSQLLDNSVL
jgi:glycosyltransferase involved in cell wall biosynthesis